MSEPAEKTCGYGAASALAFTHGKKAWRWCVRKAGHGDGDHVLGLSELDREQLKRLDARISEGKDLIRAAQDEIVRLEEERGELNARMHLADQAAGT